jgi:hypothetical protein
MNQVRTTSQYPAKSISETSSISGQMQPVKVAIPSLTDEDEVSYPPSVSVDSAMGIDRVFEESSVRKGKRKAMD